jgi:hypothetical protein
VGRDPERGRVTAFIEAVPNGARALLIRGDPGSARRRCGGGAAGQLRKARWIIDAAEARPLRGPLRDPALSEAFERVRWFPLPGEGLAQVLAARQ